MNELHEGDLFAQLTTLRDGLRADGYGLDIVATTPQVSLAITAGPDACEDCLVGKELMIRYVVAALTDLDSAIGPEDVRLLYPGETPAA